MENQFYCQDEILDMRDMLMHHLGLTDLYLERYLQNRQIGQVNDEGNYQEETRMTSNQTGNM